MSLAQPNRILVIKLRHHGDVLLSTPVVDAIKKHFPECEVDMLVYQETADIIRDNPQIARIFTIDRQWKKQGMRMQFKHEKDLFRQLKARQYDWAFNLSDQWRAAIIAKLCSKCSVGFNCIKRDNAAWRWCHDFLNPDMGTTKHIVETHLGILPPLIRPEELPHAKVRMSISPDVRNSMEQKLREQGWQGENYVLLHPGARWLFKCWEDGKKRRTRPASAEPRTQRRPDRLPQSR